MKKAVAAFADGANNVRANNPWARFVAPYRCHGMSGGIECGANKVVHARIHDDELFPAIHFRINERASTAHQRDPRSICQAPEASGTRAVSARSSPFRTCCEIEGAFSSAYRIPKPPPISMKVGRMPSRLKLPTYSASRSSPRRTDLRSRICEPTCALIPFHSSQLRIAMRPIDSPRVAPVQAELVLMASRSDVTVTASLHIRIHANRSRRAFA